MSALKTGKGEALDPHSFVCPPCARMARGQARRKLGRGQLSSCFLESGEASVFSEERFNELDEDKVRRSRASYRQWLSPAPTPPVPLDPPRARIRGARGRGRGRVRRRTALLSSRSSPRASSTGLATIWTRRRHRTLNCR